jgi:hypothetical protein
MSKTIRSLTKSRLSRTGFFFGALLKLIRGVARGTKNEGRGTKDEGQGTRDEGQGTKDKGRRTRDEG